MDIINLGPEGPIKAGSIDLASLGSATLPAVAKAAAALSMRAEGCFMKAAGSLGPLTEAEWTEVITKEVAKSTPVAW